jgi:hypothetical protein
LNSTVVIAAIDQFIRGKACDHVWFESNSLWFIRRRWIRPIRKYDTGVRSTGARGIWTGTSAWRFWR